MNEPTPPDQLLQAGPIPRALGYRLPAEWEPHNATWIAWPHRRQDWPGKFATIPWVFVEIVRALTESEPVTILVRGGFEQLRVERMLASQGVDLEQVQFHHIATDRAWLRDTAPSFLVRPPQYRTDLVAAVPWRFNGWAKYSNHRRDARVAHAIAECCHLTTFQPDVGAPRGRARRFVLEGGAIDVNGRGTLLTTEQCLLSPIQARNPGVTREQVEDVLADYLGIRRVVWLGRGIIGDDTHGHVDDIARFVGPRTVVAARSDQADDPNRPILEENWRRLETAVDQDGQPLRLIALPMPSAIRFEGERLPASYANFYIANKHVLVPTFNDPADRHALNILAEAMPDRQVVGIHAVDLVLGLGTIHCLTHEEPLAPDEPDEADTDVDHSAPSWN